MWKDLTFWRTTSWESIKEVLLQTAKNNLLVPELGDVFRPFASIKPQKIKVAMFFPETYCLKNTATGFPLFYADSPRTKYDPETAPFTFAEFAEKLRTEGYDVKTPCGRNWIRQGVFLWNVFPTTIDRETRAHEAIGWGRLTGELIETLYLVDPNIIFVFFGKKLEPFMDIVPTDSVALYFDLPDPINSKDFHDVDIFNRINRFLKAEHRQEINWSLI